LILIGLPSLYGRWLLVVFGTTQHAGLAEDVLDHRLNTRTVHMNPVSRFLYLNMNYHLEHHMFPSVPYRNLPKLHALVRDDLPAPHRGMVAAYREIIPALWRQRRDLDHDVRPALPSAPA
jgi:fatty acid desaturase